MKLNYFRILGEIGVERPWHFERHLYSVNDLVHLLSVYSVYDMFVWCGGIRRSNRHVPASDSRP